MLGCVEGTIVCASRYVRSTNVWIGTNVSPFSAAEHCRFSGTKGEDCLRSEATSSAASRKIETHRGVGAANQTVGLRGIDKGSSATPLISPNQRRNPELKRTLCHPVLALGHRLLLSNPPLLLSFHQKLQHISPNTLSIRKLGF